MPRKQYCSVKGCKNEEGNQVFKLQTRPLKLKSLERRNKWLRALGISLSTRITRIKVCTKHFCEHDIEVGIKYSPDRLLHLKPTAVPHFLVPNESPCQALVKEESGSEKQKNVIEPEAVVVPSNCLGGLLDEEISVGDDSVFLVQDCEELKSFTQLATEKPTITPQNQSSLVLKEIRVRIPGINTIFPLCRICCNPLIDKVGDPLHDLDRNDVKTVQTMLKLMLPTSEWQMYRDAVICDKCLKLVEQTFQLIQSFIKTTETLNELHEKTKNIYSEQNLLILKRSWPSQTPQNTPVNSRSDTRVYQTKVANTYNANTKLLILPTPGAITTPPSAGQAKENFGKQKAPLVTTSAPPTKQNEVQVVAAPIKQKQTVGVQTAPSAPPRKQKENFGVQEAQLMTAFAPLITQKHLFGVQPPRKKQKQSFLQQAQLMTGKKKHNFGVKQVQVVTTATPPIKQKDNSGVQQTQVTTLALPIKQKHNFGVQQQVVTTPSPIKQKENFGIQQTEVTTLTPATKEKDNLGVQQTQITIPAQVVTAAPPINQKQNFGIQQAQVVTTAPPIKLKDISELQQTQVTTPAPPIKQKQNFGIQQAQVLTTAPPIKLKDSSGLQQTQVTTPAPPIKQKQNFGKQQTQVVTSAPPIKLKDISGLQQTQVTTLVPPMKQKQNFGKQQTQVVTPAPPIKLKDSPALQQTQVTTSAPPMKQKQNFAVQQAQVVTPAPPIKLKDISGLQQTQVTTLVPPMKQKQNFGKQQTQVVTPAPPIKLKDSSGLQQTQVTTPAPPIKQKQNFEKQQAQVVTPAPPIKQEENFGTQQAQETTTFTPQIKRKINFGIHRPEATTSTVISNFDPGLALKKQEKENFTDSPERQNQVVSCRISKPTMINLRRNFDLPASAIRRNPAAFPVRVRKVILKSKVSTTKQSSTGPVLNSAKVKNIINLIKRADSKLVKTSQQKVDKKNPKTICCCVCYETFPDSMTLVQHLSLAGCKGPRAKSDLVITGL